MEKRVKRLEIDLSLCHEGTVKRGRHNFPTLSLCNSLTSLELACINISGEILESFLCSCEALECLSVKYSYSLVNLKVSGPLLRLKHLTVYDCRETKQLEISAPNLESVSYSGPEINVQFKGTPKLTEATFGSDYASDLLNVCYDLSSCISQIKVLRLEPIMSRVIWLPFFPFKGDCGRGLSTERLSFKRLEKLDVVACREQSDLHYFASLIQAFAFPSLQHFKVRLCSTGTVTRIKPEQRKIKACPRYHLKVVEIVGFIGSPLDLEFIAYLMENVVFIGKMIVDTRNINLIGGPWEFEDNEERRKAREIAELLRDLKHIDKLEIV